MSASPRDLLKPRSQRLMEVGQAIQHQNGMADSQYVTFGCKLAPGGTTTQLSIAAGEYSLGQALVEFAAQTAISLTGADAVSTLPTLSAGQACNVLVEADASQNVYLTPGNVVSAASASSAPAPALTPSRIALGNLLLGGAAAFTPGTTALTTGMCVTASYDAGNINPAGTQSGSGSTGGF